jgi:predicted transcriptional regulator
LNKYSNFHLKTVKTLINNSVIIAIMKPLCEVVSQDVLPAVRAMVAKKMIESYGFSQKSAAQKLGTTQPAISQYISKHRGHKISGVFKDYPRIIEKIDELAETISKDEATINQTTLSFCDICKLMVKEGLICKLHREMYSSLGTCSICMDNKVC